MERIEQQHLHQGSQPAAPSGVIDVEDGMALTAAVAQSKQRSVPGSGRSQRADRMSRPPQPLL
eukprot:3806384-Amphidinium_carterae.1